MCNGQLLKHLTRHSITFSIKKIMAKTILITGKKQIHSDWTMMMRYLDTDNTFKLVFADKHSKDQIRLQIDKEDMENLHQSLSKALEKLSPSVSPQWVKAFAQIAKICDNITASPNNQSAQDEIKKLATGEVSENALIEIKKLSYKIIESDNYDTGNMEILDIALVNLAFPN